MFEKIKEELVEFRNFAVKGNVVDMAVGIIIGASFGGIVNSLVKDIIMPPLGWVLGKVDFANLYLVLPTSLNPAEIQSYPTLEAAKEAGAVTISYGLFINQIINFLIVAFAIFLLIKGINKLQRATAKDAADAEAAEPTTKPCPRCTTEIPIKATKCPHCTADI